MAHVTLVVIGVRPGLRGELSRWLFQPTAGVYVGNLSAKVREKVWELVCEEVGDGRAVITWSAPTEQGFKVSSIGEDIELVDFDGVTLCRRTTIGRSTARNSRTWSNHAARSSRGKIEVRRQFGADFR